MSGVPVGRRNLFSDRRRTLLGVAGISVAIVMVLALDGIFAGAMRQVSAYITTSRASVFVSQKGVRNLHMSYSALPESSVAAIRAVKGVDWAEPILYDSDALSVLGKQQLAYVIGYRSARGGGPVSLVSGREPAEGEVVLDRQAAGALGVGEGDRLSVLNRSWRISGMTEGMTSIVNSVAYLRYEDFVEARGIHGVASFVLAGSRAPRETARRIEEATGLTASTTRAFASSEEGAVRDMSTELMAIMNTAAFLIGLVVVGLTLYASTISRLREIGVLKALGAGPGRLIAVVASQAGWMAALGILAAAPAAFALAWAVEEATGNVAILIRPGSMAKAAAGALLLGFAGAIVPLLKVMRVDPAEVFRRPA